MQDSSPAWRVGGDGDVQELEDVLGSHTDLVGLFGGLAAGSGRTAVRYGSGSRSGPNRLTPGRIERLLQVTGLRVLRRSREGEDLVWLVEPMGRPGVDVSVTVLIPCRNEIDNIDACIRRVPPMGSRTEILVIDGASTDGTWEHVEQLVASGEIEGLRLISQVPRGSDDTRADAMLAQGKADATRKGVAAATGDIVMILDADMTVAPEDLPPFYLALRDRRCDLANGARLVYTHEPGAFRPVNLAGNHLLSLMLSVIVGEPTADTLCGTKAMWRLDALRAFEAADRLLPHDPFGDFDILMGASALGLRILDVPVRYHERAGGASKVSVRRHGGSMLRLAVAGAKNIALPRWLDSRGRP